MSDTKLTGVQQHAVRHLAAAMARPGLMRGRALRRIEEADPRIGAVAVTFAPDRECALTTCITLGVGPEGEVIGCIEQEGDGA